MAWLQHLLKLVRVQWQPSREQVWEQTWGGQTDKGCGHSPEGPEVQTGPDGSRRVRGAAGEDPTGRTITRAENAPVSNGPDILRMLFRPRLLEAELHEKTWRRMPADTLNKAHGLSQTYPVSSSRRVKQGARGPKA